MIWANAILAIPLTGAAVASPLAAGRMVQHIVVDMLS
jgi:hypothetical protein